MDFGGVRKRDRPDAAMNGNGGPKKYKSEMKFSLERSMEQKSVKRKAREKIKESRQDKGSNIDRLLEIARQRNTILEKLAKDRQSYMAEQIQLKEKELDMAIICRDTSNLTEKEKANHQILYDAAMRRMMENS